MMLPADFFFVVKVIEIPCSDAQKDSVPVVEIVL
jgi:hypothetical protein